MQANIVVVFVIDLVIFNHEVLGCIVGLGSIYSDLPWSKNVSSDVGQLSGFKKMEDSVYALKVIVVTYFFIH